MKPAPFRSPCKRTRITSSRRPSPVNDLRSQTVPFEKRPENHIERAVEQYKTDSVSLSRAAGIAGYSPEEFERVLADRNIGREIGFLEDEKRETRRVPDETDDRAVYRSKSRSSPCSRSPWRSPTDGNTGENRA
ncbi:UPF0175 family protein [Halomontanus rarus]|uniref:UPF0175 family protein n=1 Tax=Halomontanus rarus TaxID=3034020 RepID=UPI0023E78A61|nr:UPF0175 family protein [Halovivax sp. TS33]